MITLTTWLLLLLAPFQLQGNKLGASYDTFAMKYATADCYYETDVSAVCDQEKIPFIGRESWMRAEFESGKMTDLEFTLAAGSKTAVQLMNDFTKKYGAPNDLNSPDTGSFIRSWSSRGQTLELRYAAMADTSLSHDLVTVELRYDLHASLSELTNLAIASPNFTTIPGTWTSGGNTIQWSSAPTNTLVEYFDHKTLVLEMSNKLVVKIHEDGTVEYGDDYTPDEAAKLFWQTVASMNPCANQTRGTN